MFSLPLSGVTFTYFIYFALDHEDYQQGRRERGRGQISPWPQGPRGLITPSVSRSGGFIK